ncbi:MAG TPA: PIG-L family deacetylase [Ktedonobacteraceae bacterium]|nr:PIG-L family deacetylase [Ktedonobacteraceae bacterium]
MVSALLKNYPYARKVMSEKDYDYIYLSPHLDDVTFSCAGSICTQKAQGLQALVITLFAGDPQPPFPPLARDCHQLWQVPEGIPPYRVRKEEDERAMAALGVDYLWLNWLEVIYRDPNLSELSDINSYDVDFHREPLFPILCRWLGDLHAAYPGAKVVAPLGIGGHRDHCVIFQAVLSTLDHATLLFFEDFPYAAYLPDEVTERTQLYHLVPLEIDITHCLEQRIRAAGLYQSQHAMLFFPPSSFREMIREYARTETPSRFVERYWQCSR